MGTSKLPGKQLLGGNLVKDLHPIHGGVVILFVSPCKGNRNKLRLGGGWATGLKYRLNVRFTMTVSGT